MIFFTKAQVVKIHTNLIKASGGTDGLRDENLLDSTLNAPFKTFDEKDLYLTVADKAVQLCYSIIENYPFIDGNKRIGIHLMLIFLELNNINLSYTQKELIDLGLEIASSAISKDEIKIWIARRLF